MCVPPTIHFAHIGFENRILVGVQMRWDSNVKELAQSSRLDVVDAYMQYNANEPFMTRSKSGKRVRNFESAQAHPKSCAAEKV